MIRLQDLTPDVYYKKSRDFQFIGRLYDILFNAVKTNADMLYNLPFSTNSSSEYLDLTALLLGFKHKHSYSEVQLKAVCAVFAEALKNKGSVKAIKLLGDAIVRAEDLPDEFTYNIDANDPYNLIMIIPQGLSDLTLFKDLLDYVLPAGMTYKIIANGVNFGIKPSTNRAFSSNVNCYTKENEEISNIFDFTDTNADSPLIKNKPGYIANSLVWKSNIEDEQEPQEGEEQNE